MKRWRHGILIDSLDAMFLLEAAVLFDYRDLTFMPKENVTYLQGWFVNMQPFLSTCVQCPRYETDQGLSLQWSKSFSVDLQGNTRIASCRQKMSHLTVVES